MEKKISVTSDPKLKVNGAQEAQKVFMSQQQNPQNNGPANATNSTISFKETPGARNANNTLSPNVTDLPNGSPASQLLPTVNGAAINN